jgi:hypothetical protein
VHRRESNGVFQLQFLRCPLLPRLLTIDWSRKSAIQPQKTVNEPLTKVSVVIHSCKVTCPCSLQPFVRQNSQMLFPKVD